jgi:hypothetical protein
MADPNGQNTRLPAGALFSTAFPPVGVAIGGLDPTGTIMVPFNLDSSGNLRVSTTSGGGGSGTTSVNLIQVGGSTIVLGQNTAINSLPVVIASNQTAIPVTGTFSATNPAVGTTGTAVPASSDFIGLNVAGNLQGWVGVAAANATAYGGRVDLSSFNGVALAIGQQVMTASIPVVLAANQSNVTTVLGAPLPAGTSAIGTVSITQALPAGTNALGTVSITQAIPAGTNAIGTVSALQVGTWTVNFAGAGISLRGAATASSTSAVVIIAAQNATTKIYVTGLQFGNTSGSTVVVTLNDSVASQFIVPAGGGNNPASFLVPLALATANASLTFTPSLAVATVYVNAQGYGAT